MTDYAAVDKSVNQSSSAPSEADYLQAELMPELDSPPIASYDQGESSLATVQPTLEATDSFDFNFIDRPVAQSLESEPAVAEEIITRLLTPWSLAGLLVLVAANGLLTVYSFTAKAPSAAVSMGNFNGLPPVFSGLPPISEASPNLQLQKLSEVAVPKEPEQSNPTTANTGVAIAPSNASNLPQPNVPPPPTVIIPPAQPVPMTGYSPYLQDPGYMAAAPGSMQPPRPGQSPQNLPTIAIQPIHQPQAAAPLPPPPPPPVSNPGNIPPPPNSGVNYAPPMASNVESQMYQQLPNADSSKCRRGP